ncbi:MAG: HI0074 family nucleotidyltransferase substrate-binding subunit [Planctomycetota bacterium]
MTPEQPRWVQRYENFDGAVRRLNAACEQSTYSDLERAGLVQMFELAFEMTWKLLKDILAYQGIESKSPRETIRRGFEAGFYDETETGVFLDALHKRDLFMRTYDDSVAIEAVDLIKSQYYPLLMSIHQRLKTKRETL